MKLDEHIKIDEKRFCVIEERLISIESSMDLIKAANADALKSMSESLSRILNDLDWLKRFFWLVTTGVVGSFITSVITLIINR